jgi:predicted dehydrogenase
MATLNLAVLGLFHGRRFVECLRRSRVARLVAVADLRPERADFLGKEVEVYRDYKELLLKTRGRIDGVIAALPNDLHVEVTEEAANAGLPLLLEKPIACNLEDAERIVKTVHAAKMKLMVGHHRRFSKRVARVKEAIQEGRLGRIIGANVVMTAKKIDEYFQPAWRVTRDVGGVLLINGIHDVDLLRHFLGEVAMVQAQTTNTSRGHEAEDTGAAILTFRSNAVATIFITDNSPSPWYYEVYGEEYNYSYAINYNSYQFFGDEASLTFPGMDLFYYEKDPDAGWPRPIKQERLTVDRFDVIEEEVKHFCDIIRGEAEPRVTAEDAAESLRVILAIKESSRLGRAICLDRSTAPVHSNHHGTNRDGPMPA